MTKLITLLILAGMLIAATACENGEHEQQEDMDIEQEMAEAQQTEGFDTSAEFQSGLEEALTVYLELVDALVEEKPEEADAYADQFHNAILSIDDADLDQSASTFWKEYSGLIESHTGALQNHDDIDNQRYEFENISEAFIEVVKSMGPVDMALYQQRCPMVRDDEADWLSSHEEIRNPYHGESMMNCGSTVEEI